MVVDDYAQPRPARLPIVAYRPEIKPCVIGLPDLVRTFSLAAMDKVVSRAIGFFTGDGERLQILRDGANDVVDSVVTGWFAVLGTCDTADFPIYGAGTERGSLQRETFGEMAQIVRQAATFSLIGPPGPGQTNQPEPTVPAHPVLSCPQRERRFLGDAG